ncbi:hypothetical protein OG864_45025 [Streptomyces sp. NBC_00124]|uniref:hypothetical protein n=1 Tax=Streptomyces sp. NBC_00124 TaxID=2975662 RepID=UPI0022581DDA|nr:hypothetical protein [Streptomyces sp. NBC_00124]MCX5365865.1 hypothetical protein [Streptomyces sp. NBC_00124]
MRPGTGRRRAGADNVRLRAKMRNLRDDLAWYQVRLKAATARARALQAQAEIVDVERLLDAQLIYRQAAELAALHEENKELRRRLAASSDDTVETPIVTAAELAAA